MKEKNQHKPITKVYTFRPEIFTDKVQFDNKPVPLEDGFFKKFFKQFFCFHNHIEFIRNIYGDEINMISLFHVYRSEWKCKKCGKTIYKEELIELEEEDLFMKLSKK